MLFKVIVVISFVTALAQIAHKTQCRHDNECGVGECCYYHEGPMIVSKRQSLLPFNKMHQGGWCEQYQALGSRCSPFDKLNGHCSCAPGLTCKRFPYTTPSSVVKRKLLAGDYLCAPVE